MFVKTSDYRFERTVTVLSPSATERDKIQRDTFVATFVALPPEELEAFDEELSKAMTMKDVVRFQLDLAARITVGWSDVAEEDKTPIAFSAEHLRDYCRDPNFRDGLISAYRAAMRGEEARLGN